jgi:hypothetical protein
MQALENKKPKTGQFSGHASRQPRLSDEVNFTFFHPDCTVGSGVSPDHALGRSPDWLEELRPARGLYHRSGVAPQPAANSVETFTLPRRYIYFSSQLYLVK